MVKKRVCVRLCVFIDTAVVPSFTLLPVSLFPVYLAVICFTKSVMVWDDLCVSSSHHWHPQTADMRSTCLCILVKRTALLWEESAAGVYSLNEWAVGLILSDVCWLFFTKKENAWNKGKYLKFSCSIPVNMKMSYCALKEVCRHKVVVAVVTLQCSCRALTHSVSPKRRTGEWTEAYRLRGPCLKKKRKCQGAWRLHFLRLTCKVKSLNV